MKKLIVACSLIVASALFANSNCQALEKEAADLKSKLDTILKEMKTPGITKDEYNEKKAEALAVNKEYQAKKKEADACSLKEGAKHKFLFNEGNTKYKEQKFDLALKDYLEAITITKEKEPNNTTLLQDLYRQVAFCYNKLNNFEELGKYIVLITDNTTKGKLYALKARGLEDKKAQDAIAAYEEMAKFYMPELAYYSIGLIYDTKLFNKRSAVAYYEKSIAAKKEDPKVYEAIGQAYVDIDTKVKQEKDANLLKAIGYFETGISYAKKSNYQNLPRLAWRLASASNLKGNYQKGLDAANLAISSFKGKKYALGYLEKGIALYNLKKTEEAKAALSVALEDISTKSSAQSWLEQIKNNK